MQIIKFVMVDAKDGIPADQFPNRHGPKRPIESIKILGWEGSNPAFYYGAVEDAVDVSVPGIISVLTGEEVTSYLERRKSEELSKLSAYRFEKETGGLDLGDLTILTDRESQAQLTGAFNSLKNGTITDTDWKFADGWQTVTLAEVEVLVKSVVEHVRKCFRAERVVATKMAQMSLEELASYDLYSELDSVYSTTEDSQVA